MAVANSSTVSISLKLNDQGVVTGLKQVERQSDEVGDSLKNTGNSGRRSLGDLEKKANSANRSFSTLEKTIATVSAAFATAAIVDAATEIAEATMRAEALNQALVANTASSVQVAAEMKFISGTAERLGINLVSLEKSYKGVIGASNGTVLAGEPVRKIMTSVAEASAVLGLRADETNGILNAMNQMISKGKVQAEELRGQLGERLPGAFQIAAKAMGVSTVELDQMLSRGEVLAEDLLPKLADELHNRFGNAAEKAGESARASFERFNNAVEQLKRTIGESGVVDWFAEITDKATDTIRKIDDLTATNLPGYINDTKAAISGLKSVVDALGVDNLGMGLVGYALFGPKAGALMYSLSTLNNYLKNFNLNVGSLSPSQFMKDFQDAISGEWGKQAGKIDYITITPLDYDDYIDSWAKKADSMEDVSARINKALEEAFNLEGVIEIVDVAAIRAKEVLEAHKKRIEQLRKAWDQGVVTDEYYNHMVDQYRKEETVFADMTGNKEDAHELFLSRMRDLNQDYYADEIALIKGHEKAWEDRIEAEKKLDEDLKKQLIDNADQALGDWFYDLDELEKKHRDHTDAVDDLWQHMTENIQDDFSEAIYGMLDGQLDSWGDFFDSIFGMFKSMVAEMVAYDLVGRIFDTDGTGVGLFTGGKSGNGIIGSIFNGGSSISTLGTLGSIIGGAAIYNASTIGASAADVATGYASDLILDQTQISYDYNKIVSDIFDTVSNSFKEAFNVGGILDKLNENVITDQLGTVVDGFTDVAGDVTDALGNVVDQAGGLQNAAMWAGAIYSACNTVSNWDDYNTTQKVTSTASTGAAIYGAMYSNPYTAALGAMLTIATNAFSDNKVPYASGDVSATATGDRNLYSLSVDDFSQANWDDMDKDTFQTIIDRQLGTYQRLFDSLSEEAQNQISDGLQDITFDDLRLYGSTGQFGELESETRYYETDNGKMSSWDDTSVRYIENIFQDALDSVFVDAGAIDYISQTVEGFKSLENSVYDLLKEGSAPTIQEYGGDSTTFEKEVGGWELTDYLDRITSATETFSEKSTLIADLESDLVTVMASPEMTGTGEDRDYDLDRLAKIADISEEIEKLKSLPEDLWNAVLSGFEGGLPEMVEYVDRLAAAQLAWDDFSAEILEAALSTEEVTAESFASIQTILERSADIDPDKVGTAIKERLEDAATTHIESSILGDELQVELIQSLSDIGVESIQTAEDLEQYRGAIEEINTAIAQAETVYQSSIETLNSMLGMDTSSISETIESVNAQFDEMVASMEDVGIASEKITEIEGQREQAINHSIGVAVTGIDVDNLSSALWSAIQNGQDAQTFVTSLESQVRSGVAQATVNAFSESIYSAFIAPINEQMGAAVSSMVSEIIAGGTITSATLQSGIEAISASIDAATEMLNNPELIAKIEELMTTVSDMASETTTSTSSSSTSSSASSGSGSYTSSTSTAKSAAEVNAYYNSEAYAAKIKYHEDVAAFNEELSKGFSTGEITDYAAALSDLESRYEALEATATSLGISTSQLNEMYEAEKQRLTDIINFNASLDDIIAEHTLSDYEYALQNLNQWQSEQIAEAEQLGLATDKVTKAYRLQVQALDEKREAEIDSLNTSYQETIDENTLPDWKKEYADLEEWRQEEAAKLDELEASHDKLNKAYDLQKQALDEGLIEKAKEISDTFDAALNPLNTYQTAQQQLIDKYTDIVVTMYEYGTIFDEHGNYTEAAALALSAFTAEMELLTETTLNSISSIQATITGTETQNSIQQASAALGLDASLFSTETGRANALQGIAGMSPESILDYLNSVGADDTDLSNLVSLLMGQQTGITDITDSLKSDLAASGLEGTDLEMFNVSRQADDYRDTLTGLGASDESMAIVDQWESDQLSQIKKEAEEAEEELEDLADRISDFNASLDDIIAQNTMGEYQYQIYQLDQWFDEQKATADELGISLEKLNYAYDLQLEAIEKQRQAAIEAFDLNLDDILAENSLDTLGIELRQLNQWYAEQKEEAESLEISLEKLTRAYEVQREAAYEASVETARNAYRSAVADELSKAQEKQTELEQNFSDTKSTYIAVLQDEISKQQEAASAAESASNQFESLAETLKDASDSLARSELSGGSPDQIYRESRSQLDSLMQDIWSGDEERMAIAMSDLPGISTDFLDASKNQTANYEEYIRDVAKVQSYLNTAQGIAENRKSTEELTLEQNTAQTEHLQAILDGLLDDQLPSLADAESNYFDAKERLDESHYEDQIDHYQAELDRLDLIITGNTNIETALGTYQDALTSAISAGYNSFSSELAALKNSRSDSANASTSSSTSAVTDSAAISSSVADSSERTVKILKETDTGVMFSIWEGDKQISSVGASTAARSFVGNIEEKYGVDVPGYGYGFADGGTVSGPTSGYHLPTTFHGVEHITPDSQMKGVKEELAELKKLFNMMLNTMGMVNGSTQDMATALKTSSREQKPLLVKVAA